MILSTKGTKIKAGVLEGPTLHGERKIDGFLPPKLTLETASLENVTSNSDFEADYKEAQAL